MIQDVQTKKTNSVFVLNKKGMGRIMSEKVKRVGFICFLIVSGLLLSCAGVFAKNIFEKEKSPKEASEVLSAINNYQESYFEIIKRNDVLLTIEQDKTINKDRKDLNKLYKKVKKQVSNKYYLRKYNNIKNRYAECDDITDVGMKEFAAANYKDVDNLLNEVYKEVKAKISPEDFEQLAQSETKWLKEAENYGNNFNSMDYGTIGTLIYYDYQIDVREFRTLLLMLYL